MRPLRSFATRNYITILLCAVAVTAFLGAGLSPASGWRDISVLPNISSDGRSLTNLLTETAVNNHVTNPTAGRANPRSNIASLLSPAKATSSALLPAAPFVPSITATLADALQVDNNNSGKADPGDTLMYTVTITNSGTDATGVMFTDDLSQNGGNLTLVAGSVNSSPVARPDSYPNGVGNTRMTVNAAAGVLVNDFDPDGTSPTAVAITNGPTTNGGTVNLATDGSFIYDPPVGFTGTDTFTYTATDGTKTDTATVSITLTSMVWYVDNTYIGATSDGRSATPFKTLAPLQGADPDNPGDIIYVRENGGGAYTGGLVLENNQQLIGNGVALVVNSQTLAPAGSKPTITNSGGNGVTLASGNTVRGLIAQTTAAGGASAGIAGSSVGNLTADTLQAVGNPGAAVDIQTAGTLAVTFESLSSTNGTRGFRLTSATGGTFTVSGATTITGTTGDGVTITSGNPNVNFSGGVNVTTSSGKGIVANAAGTLQSGSSSTVNATGGAALDLQSMNFGTGLNFTSLASTNSSAEGIKTSGCIQNISVSGTTNIQTPTAVGIDISSTFGTSTFSFGNTTVNKTSAGTGVNLNSNGTSTIGFGTLNITAGNGSGLVAATSGTVNSTSGTISATNGPGLNLSSVTSGLALTSVSSTNSGTTGLSLTTVGGSLSIGTTTVTNPTGIGISVTSSSAMLNLGDTTANTSGSTGVVLGGSGVGNSGPITFATLNVAPDAGQRGLLAQENSGTITVNTDADNTGGAISTSSAVAVEITRSSGTTPLDIHLTNVSANGGTNGIILTRTSGSFTVTGNSSGFLGGQVTGTPPTVTMAPDTADATGGTIQSTTGAGILLNTVSDVSFTRMWVKNALDDGIGGTAVTGFELNNCLIDNNGNAVGEEGLDFDNLFGTSSITNSTIRLSHENNVEVRNTSNDGAQATLTITGCQISNASAKTQSDDGVLYQMTGTSNGSVDVSNSVFTANRGDHLQGNQANSASLNAVFANNNLIGGHSTALGQDIVVNAAIVTGSPTITYDINGNKINGAILSAITVNLGVPSSSTATMSGKVRNNIIGTTGVIRSGSEQAHGIAVDSHGKGTHTVSVTGNTMRQCKDRGINVTANDSPSITNGEAQPGGTLNLTVQGNAVLEGGPINPPGFPADGTGSREAFNLIAGSTATDTIAICAQVGGAGALANNFNRGTEAIISGLSDIRIKKQTTAVITIRLPGYAGSATDASAFVAGMNTSSEDGSCTATASATSSGAGGGGFVGGAACDLPPMGMMAPLDVQAANAPAIFDGKTSEREEILRTTRGEGPGGNNVIRLTQQELMWMVHAALERWRGAGISSEDLARMQAVTFEIADLPEGQLAIPSGTLIKIDETAANFGWYIDQFPNTDNEFDVPVLGKERQASELSPAFGQMDLLTVIMRELGHVYLEGKDRIPKRLQRLMQNNLSPGVRRLPLDQWKVAPPSPTGSTQSTTGDRLMAQASATIQPDAVQPNSSPVAAQVEKPAAKPEASTAKIPSAARYAVFHRLAATRPRDVAVMGIHEASSEPASPTNVRRVAMTTQKAGGKKNLTPNATLSGGIVSVGPFNLPAGETVTIMFNATIDTPVLPAGTTQVCTRGTVTANGGISVQTTDPGPPVVNGATCTTLAQADLAVTKTDAPDPVTTGNNITYTINLTNNGPDAAYNAQVSDATPLNTTFVSATPPAGWMATTPVVGGTGNIVFSRNPAGPVANGGTATFTVVVNVNAATPGGTIITNNAVATSDTPDGTQANNTGTATTTTQSQADLAVTKSDSPDPVFAGNNLTYTINFVNNGPGSATNVTVTDAVPANTTFVSATVTTGSGWSTSVPAVGGTGNVVFSKATVPNGETAVFTIVVKVNSNTASGTTITNSVSAAPTSSDPDTSNNTAMTTTTVNTQADLAIFNADSPDPVSAGANITYFVDVENLGPSNAQMVTVTDAVPANTTFVSATVTGGFPGWSITSQPSVGGTGNVVFSNGTLGPVPTGTGTFQIVVKVGSNVASGTIISNTATAATTTTDPTSSNDTANAMTTVQTRADLAVTKTDSPDPVTAGNNLTYTINFVNNGPSDAQTVTVTDAVPANCTFVSAMVTTGSGWGTTTPSVGGTGNVTFSKPTVAAGETAVFTMVVNVNASTANGTTITNNAVAASTTTDPTPANNTGTATTTAQASADLAVTKADSPDPVTAGNNITYTINLTNNGPSDAQTVTVTDATPANTTFVSASVTTGSGWGIAMPAVGGTGNVVFSKATVAAGETAVFTVVVKVNSSTAGGTIITNNAVAASTTTDPDSSNNTGTATTTVQAQADVSITKSDSPDPVFAGNNITYTINFTNNGPSDALTVSITDAVPANTTFVSAMVTTGSGWGTTAPGVGMTGNVVFSKAMVVAGETAVFTIVVNVNASTADGSTINNSATVASTSTDPTSGNNTATADTAVQTRADLAVTKSDSPDPVTAGNNLTYTINFVNNGPSDAQTVTVTDAVPANCTFVSAMVTTGSGWGVTAPAVGGTGNVTFSKTTVAAGETAVFTMVVKVNSSAVNGSTITNSATAATTTTDPTSGNNTGSATTTVQTQADLAVTKSDSPDPVFAGANLTYTINFVNNGPSDAQSVTVTDAVPANCTFVSAMVTTGSGWSITSPAVGATGNVVFSKATVAAGETAVFTMVVKVNSNTANGTTINNSAVAASTTTDPIPANNTGTATTTVQLNADLAVTKSDSPDPVVASQNLTYTINFVNNGPSDAQTVTVTDAVPANCTFVSATVTTGSGWSTGAPAVGGTGNVVFSKGTVVAGETAVFTIVVNVNANTPHNTIITNSATAASTTPDNNSGNNTGTATTTVIAQADLAVTKSDSPDPVCVMSNITYTVSFVNNGPGPGLSTTVTDAVPANTTFVSAVVTTGSGWAVTAPAVGGTGNVVFSKASTASGETAVFTIVVKVNAGVVHGTVITNSATAASTIPDPTPGNNTGTAMTTVDPVAPMISCPANITQSTDPNQCSAVVNYTTTASDNCPGVVVVCNPPSGSTFPKGTTTVNCTATDVAGNTAMCSFMVTVNDTQAPSITCPANVTSVTPDIGGTSAVVTYPNPTASDNCPGVTSACNPPSGSTFPTGCTTVTCTATDTSSNTATCTFQVCVFNVCLQDDSNPNNRLMFNTLTGDYRWCCNGVTYTGKGKVTSQGSTYTLEHNPIDRRVRVTVTGSAHSGNGTLKSPPTTLRCNLTDSNTTNNTMCVTCQ